MRYDKVLAELECEGCAHVWVPRRQVLPKFCPKCKRRTWNRSGGSELRAAPERKWALKGRQVRRGCGSVRARPGRAGFNFAEGVVDG